LIWKLNSRKTPLKHAVIEHSAKFNAFTGRTSTGAKYLIAAVSCALWAASPTASAQIVAGKQVESVLTTAGPISVQNVVGGLEHPWGMAFLPDGRLLVTERPGRLRILNKNGDLSEPLQGTPEVYAQGHGGLMDVALHPDFKNNQVVYLTFAAPGPDDTAATALGRGRLVENSVEDFEVIFRQKPWVNGDYHFGNRIVFDGQGHLFLTLGERFQFDPAQDLNNHLGKVIRLNLDGSVPEDNPFVNQQNALPEIWSYGHRNIEAAAMHPEADDLWVMEMGPLGGDELNRPQPGKNYGWPVVSWGIHYDGRDIPDPPTHPEIADAVLHFTPVISPSGMVFYNGDTFKQWQGNAFTGGLSGQELVRLEINGKSAKDAERIPLPERIRDVEQGPDGNLYLLTSPKDGQGNVWRVSPLQ
jgi:glucose/arabinose dehydrogenase